MGKKRTPEEEAAIKREIQKGVRLRRSWAEIGRRTVPPMTRVSIYERYRQMVRDEEIEDPRLDRAPFTKRKPQKE